MGKQLIDFGMHVDILTKDELDKSLSAAAETWRQKAAGVDYLTRRILGIGTASYMIEGPAQGYSWSVKMVSAALSASGQLQVWWDAQATLPAAPPTAAGTSGVLTWGSDSLVLKPGQSLYATASAGTIVSLMVAAWQTPAERLGVYR